MRYWLTLLFTITCCYLIQAQLVVSTETHDFGELTSESQRYVDITVKNTGETTFRIFSVRKPREVSSIISSKTVVPDSSSTIRLQVNPRKKGSFSYEVQVFTSNQNEATFIELKGKLLEYDPSNKHLFTACPTFSEKPSGVDPQSFQLTVVTIDKDTKKALSQSQVSLIQKGVEVWTLPTNQKGEITRKASLGRSYFVANHIGYKPLEVGQYINFKRNLVLLALEKDSTTIEDTLNLVQSKQEAPKNKTQVPTKPDNIVQETSKEIPSPIVKWADIPEESFKEENFKPINVVFVLDISSSMRQADKIELMKYSLMQLSKMLRPQDKFGIVSYASNSKVVLPSSSGNQIEKIQSEIQNLEAKGFTSGSKGIQLGYETAYEARINAGANHVIIITDGAFNQDSKAYLKQIKKYKRKGITLSVVGIKCKPKEKLELEKIASLGQGNYIAIDQLSEANDGLRNEVRQQAFRTK